MKVLKRCEECKKPIRNWNKSGKCTNCYSKWEHRKVYYKEKVK